MEQPRLTENEVIAKINALMDAALEEAEATLLRLDVNRHNIEKNGKFEDRHGKKKELLMLNRYRNKLFDGVPASPSAFRSLSKACIPISPKSDYSVLRLDPDSASDDCGPLAQASAVNAIKKSNSSRASKKKNNKHKKKDTTANNKAMKATKRYPKERENGQKCDKCCSLKAISYTNSDSSLASSKPVTFTGSTSRKSNKKPKKRSQTTTDSFTTSRIPSSVVTEDDETTETYPQSPTCHSRHRALQPKSPARSFSSSKNLHKSRRSESGVSLNFTAMMKDPKSGKVHPLNIIAKCQDGTPARVYINGKAFGPCEE